MATTETRMLPARRTGTVATRQPQRVPGAQLLDVVRQWLGTYARFPSEGALDAVTLWAVHAHCRDKDGVLVFRATPRLYLLSSEPGSGKSRVLELLGMLCPATFGLDLEPTAAGLVYTIARERATVLIDEGDILFGAGARKAAVRAIINGGYTRHGTYLNGRGAKASRVPVFGALAMAGLDVMEKGTGDTLNALMSRGVKIRMQRAGGDDRPAKVTQVSEGQAVKLSGWLAAWAAQERAGLAVADPVAPEGIDGRAEQIWAPLLAVADAAGGEWPERARAACTELALAGSPAAQEEVAGQIAAFAAACGFPVTDTERSA